MTQKLGTLLIMITTTDIIYCTNGRKKYTNINEKLNFFRNEKQNVMKSSKRFLLDSHYLRVRNRF